MPKTIASMKKRLEEALQKADEAEELVEVMKEVIAAYGIMPVSGSSGAEPTGDRRVHG